ncbi:MAG: UPF0182 family protein [Anaerolineae bacterium]|nr:UPF0182 family protein [Anaerolineae bacterium]
MLITHKKTRKIMNWVIIILVFLLFAWFFSSSLITLYTDYLWFQSLDYTQIFTRRLATSLGLMLITSLIAAGFLLLNWVVVPHWIAPKAELTGSVPFASYFQASSKTSGSKPKTFTVSTRPLRRTFTLSAIAVGVIIGLTLMYQWDTYLLSRQGQPFGIGDPIFNQDIGFYIFDLPWYKVLLNRLQTLIVLTTIGVVVRYAMFGQLEARRTVTHMSLLSSLWLILIGIGRLLNRYSLLQSHNGVVFGAGYTDVNARIPLYTIEAILFFAAAVVLIVNAFTRKWKLLLYIGAFWLILSFVGPGYPALIQRFTVEPNEFVVERPYIEQNIRYTRYAYGLDQIEEQEYPTEGSLALEDLSDHADVIGNMRLWDYRPLLRTFGQLQEIRLYYTFNGVDIDRYSLDGQPREVMLSARELEVNQLAEQAKTWVNEHIIFTHGYGVTMSPVNEVSKEGLPSLIVKDIPPITDYPELIITRPQIYFGESTWQYVVINTTEQEFDYPQGDANAYTRYEGPDGVRLGGLLRRILLATRFGSTQMLFSPALNRDSRILFHRTIQNRAQTIAPMLWYDPDTYPVIVDGHIVWLLDAYTWTGDFPYSEPLHAQNAPNVNYIRNSVKITVDAYTGEITYYLLDPDDPIAATYRRIFPELFKPITEMPVTLREHWRYPETLFLYQSQLYATYHMRDPQVFYNREDLWDIPQELVETEQQVMEPYYVLMRIPGSEDIEFVLIRPYVPKEKQNMVAWLYADCDGEDYGRLGIVKLSKDRLVYGPLQVEARADQDPIISQQLSLWNQRGSRVLRGNLLVIPIQGTFLYIEPLYLEAESGQLPELKRIIVSYDDRVAMAPTLEEALLQVLSSDTSTLPADISGDITPDGTLSELAQQAWDHYQAAQACLAAGDWACYGEEQHALEDILRAMVDARE